MGEDKTLAKAFYLNTGDKKKSKYSPQKIHSSTEFGSKQFKSRFIRRDRVWLICASVKPFVIGSNLQEENSSCKFGALQGMKVLRGGANYRNRKWEAKDFEKVYTRLCNNRQGRWTQVRPLAWGCAIPMSSHEDKTAVRGCHYQGDVIVRLCKGTRRTSEFVRVLHCLVL